MAESDICKNCRIGAISLERELMNSFWKSAGLALAGSVMKGMLSEEYNNGFQSTEVNIKDKNNPPSASSASPSLTKMLERRSTN